MAGRGTTIDVSSAQSATRSENFDVGLPCAARPNPQSKTYRFDVVCELLDIGPRTLQRWELLGLVEAVDGRFDFQDLLALRTIIDLVSGGVSPHAIVRSVRGLKRVLPDVERPLAQLRLVPVNDTLHADLDDTLISPDGQYVMRFAASELGGTPSAYEEGRDDESLSWTALDWHDHALALEGDGEIDESITSYRRALAMQSHFPEVHFNLGYLLRGTRRFEAAEAHLQLAVMQDPDLHVAWYLLADVQQRLGFETESLQSLRTALDHCPTLDQARWSAACVTATC